MAADSEGPYSQIRDLEAARLKHKYGSRRVQAVGRDTNGRAVVVLKPSRKARF